MALVARSQVKKAGEELRTVIEYVAPQEAPPVLLDLTPRPARLSCSARSTFLPRAPLAAMLSGASRALWYSRRNEIRPPATVIRTARRGPGR